MDLKGTVLNRFPPTAIGLSAATVVLALVPAYAVADPTATPSPTATSTSSHNQAITVTVSTPRAAHSSITVTVTGLRDGQWIDIDGHPDGWTDEAPYHREVQQTGSGPLATQLDAPVRGWPDGKYRWTITLPDGTPIHRSFTFTRQSHVNGPTSNQPPKNKAPRDKAGGLANTGV